MLLVAAGLIYRDDELLITQRPLGKHGALKWEFPGGKIETDEDPRECLKREVLEELDIVISVGKIVETVFHRYPERSVTLLFYECKYVSGEPKAIDCQAFEWVSPSHLAEYNFLEADLDFIHRIGQQSNSSGTAS